MQTRSINWQQADSQQDLAQRLAELIQTRLSQIVAERGSAVVAFSGGSTPKPLFKALQKCKLDWSKIIVTLVDERWVPPSHPLSNGQFLNQHLLAHLNPKAVFFPLFHSFQPSLNAADAKHSVLAKYCKLTNSDTHYPREFDVAILGMGEDAHTASFFPDADNIRDLVNPNSDESLMTCESETSQVERITWSLPMLLKSRFLALHFTGHRKKRVFEQACQECDAISMPIRAFIHQSDNPLQVFYND